MHGDYNEDHGMTTAIDSEMTVSKSIINRKLELLCVKIFYASSQLRFGVFLCSNPLCM